MPKEWFILSDVTFNHSFVLGASLLAVILLGRVIKTPSLQGYFILVPGACLVLALLGRLALQHATVRFWGLPDFLHIMSAWLALGLLSLSGLQCLLLAFKNYGLRHPKSPRWYLCLPALEHLERLSFYTLLLGFSLLTLCLLSGFLYPRGTTIFHEPQKLGGYGLAWVCFGILLYGHYQSGWRGANTHRWWLGGSFLLWLAYWSGQ